MSFSTRGLFLLLCAVLAAGQTSRRPPGSKSQPAPSRFLLDAMAETADGNPALGLAEADFSVSVNGEPRKLSGAWRLDAKAGTVTPPTPEMAITPDQIHRTLVFVADDLGLSAEQSRRVRQALMHFLADQMLPNDLIAIVRTASGSGTNQKLTANRRDLEAAISAIQYNPAQGADQQFASGARSALRSVLSGLTDVFGRKAVVLFTGNRALLERPVPASWMDTADSTMTVFSVIDVTGVPSEPGAEKGLNLFAAATGGRCPHAADLASALAGIAQDQNGYYLVRYETTGISTHPVLTTNRAGVKLRTRQLPLRNGVLRSSLLDAWRPAFTTPAADLRRGLTNPFAAGDIPLRFTASYKSKLIGSGIEGHVFIDTKDLTFTHWLDGRINCTLDIQIAAFGEDSQQVLNESKSYSGQLTQERFDKLLKEGFTATIPIPNSSPGPYQVRVSVRDGTSGRIGSASQFLNVPDTSSGQLAVDGIDISAKNDEEGTALFHIVHAGETFSVMYQVVNPTTSDDKRSQIEEQTEISSDGRSVFTSAPAVINFAHAADTQHRYAMEEIRLGTLGPGSYLLRITVKDKLAKEARTATEYTWFEVK